MIPQDIYEVNKYRESSNPSVSFAKCGVLADSQFTRWNWAVVFQRITSTGIVYVSLFRWKDLFWQMFDCNRFVFWTTISFSFVCFIYIFFFSFPGKSEKSFKIAVFPKTYILFFLHFHITLLYLTSYSQNTFSLVFLNLKLVVFSRVFCLNLSFFSVNFS